MVHLTDHMEGRTCCSLAVCAHFVQRKVILAYCGHMIAHRSNMPQVFRWCLHAVAGRRAALAPAPLSPGLAGGGGSSAEGGAAVRLAGGGSGSGPRVGCARYGQLGLRRASGRPSPPLSGVRCAALGLARFGAATDERLVSEGWRTQAWPPILASPTKKKSGSLDYCLHGKK